MSATWGCVTEQVCGRTSLHYFSELWPIGFCSCQWNDSGSFKLLGASIGLFSWCDALLLKRVWLRPCVFSAFCARALDGPRFCARARRSLHTDERMRSSLQTRTSALDQDSSSVHSSRTMIGASRHSASPAAALAPRSPCFSGPHNRLPLCAPTHGTQTDPCSCVSVDLTHRSLGPFCSLAA